MTQKQAEFDFDGPAYDEKHDQKRLTGQIMAIFDFMRDARWSTLTELERALKYPQASISAQLRHLRKRRFGGHTVERRRRGERGNGLHEYRLIVNEI